MILGDTDYIITFIDSKSTAIKLLTTISGVGLIWRTGSNALEYIPNEEAYVIGIERNYKGQWVIFMDSGTNTWSETKKRYNNVLSNEEFMNVILLKYKLKDFLGI